MFVQQAFTYNREKKFHNYSEVNHIHIYLLSVVVFVVRVHLLTSPSMIKETPTKPLKIKVINLFSFKNPDLKLSGQRGKWIC